MFVTLETVSTVIEVLTLTEQLNHISPARLAGLSVDWFGPVHTTFCNRSQTDNQTEPNRVSVNAVYVMHACMLVCAAMV